MNTTVNVTQFVVSELHEICSKGVKCVNTTVYVTQFVVSELHEICSKGVKCVNTTVNVTQFKVKEAFVCSQACEINTELYLLQTKLCQDG